MLLDDLHALPANAHDDDVDGFVLFHSQLFELGDMNVVFHIYVINGSGWTHLRAVVMSIVLIQQSFANVHGTQIQRAVRYSIMATALCMHAAEYHHGIGLIRGIIH